MQPLSDDEVMMWLGFNQHEREVISAIAEERGVAAPRYVIAAVVRNALDLPPSR
jgi:hypothetical protein